MFLPTKRFVRSERKYILKALKAGKHVLLKDPLSTSFDEFTEQLAYAKKYQKFVQFSTTFVHQYRVRRFMDRVLREDIFGRIHNISASLQVNYDELEKVGVKLPISEPHDGCIRVLGRFCVLVATLMFSRLGSTAISAKVHNAERGSKGEFISAECTINFTQVSHFLTVNFSLQPLVSLTFFVSCIEPNLKIRCWLHQFLHAAIY